MKKSATVTAVYVGVCVNLIKKREKILCYHFRCAKKNSTEQISYLQWEYPIKAPY